MSDNDTMREAFIQACKEYGPTISFSDFEMGWDACIAWQAANAAALPPGFVAVPVEPTKKMIDAGRWMEHYEESSNLYYVDDMSVQSVYEAMLSTRPEVK